MSTVTIPLSTPIAQRLALLERKALEGSRSRSVIELARSLCDRGMMYPAYWWLRPLVSVQSLPVLGDPPGVDVYRDAVETLARGGDCANKSALLAALYIAARGRCERAPVRIVWEHCGSECPFDHVRVDLYVNGAQWLLDPLSPVSPGARAVSWPAREVIAGRWL